MFRLRQVHRLAAVVALLATVVAAALSPTNTANASDGCDMPTITYIVKRGDTLWRISRQFNTTISTLVCLNHIANPNWIFAGQDLLVPDPDPDPPVVWTDPPVQIEVFSPVTDAVYHSPIEVIGFSQTFEATVNIELWDADDNVIAERIAMGGSVDGFDFFESYVRFVVNEQTDGELHVFEISAMDGSRINEVVIPVVLLPGQRVVDLNGPAVGQVVCDPILVRGYSNTFEANVVIDVAERDGSGLDLKPTLGGNFGLYADFSDTLTAGLTDPAPLLVSAYESNGIGIGEIDRTRVPVTYHPPGSPECP